MMIDWLTSIITSVTGILHWVPLIQKHNDLGLIKNYVDLDDELESCVFMWQIEKIPLLSLLPFPLPLECFICSK